MTHIPSPTRLTSMAQSNPNPFRRLLGAGATGKFVNNTGKGEVTYAIAAEHDSNSIVLDFGEPTQYVEMSEPSAREFAVNVLASCDQLLTKQVDAKNKAAKATSEKAAEPHKPTPPQAAPAPVKPDYLASSKK